MGLGSTQTEIITKNLPRVKDQSVRKSYSLIAIREPIVWKL